MNVSIDFGISKARWPFPPSCVAILVNRLRRTVGKRSSAPFDRLMQLSICERGVSNSHLSMDKVSLITVCVVVQVGRSRCKRAVA